MTAKRYAIGYTVFEYNGNVKIPVDRFKPVPGNVDKAMRALERRLKTLAKDKKFHGLVVFSFSYGFMVRYLLSL